MNTSDFRHFPVSRDQVLVAHAQAMIARTNLAQEDFATALNACVFMLAPAKAAEKGLPNLAALMKTASVADYNRDAGKWLKRVERWLAGDVELPSWVEEAWVQALAPEYREHCINELAARHGLVGARQQAAGAAHPATVFGQLISRLGNAVEAGSEVLADGHIDLQDLPLLPALIEQLLAVESRACELRRFAENVRDAGPLMRVVG